VTSISRAVDRGERPELGPCVPEALGDPVHDLPQGLAVERVATDQVGRVDVVDHRGDRPWQIPRLAETDLAFVGVDVDPEDVEELLDADRFDLRDLHVFASCLNSVRFCGRGARLSDTGCYTRTPSHEDRRLRRLVRRL
jgi:hypothetical protein